MVLPNITSAQLEKAEHYQDIERPRILCLPTMRDLSVLACNSTFMPVSALHSCSSGDRHHAQAAYAVQTDS